MFKKLLIANRGEIACRIIKTAKKMGIRTVAIYSEIDARALHVQSADESFCIGPAASAASYLNSEKIIQIARGAQVDAIHPGYGFLSEDAEFAEQCQRAGLIFVGPSPHAIRTMGDKNLAKTTMAAAGVPVVPGYHADDIDLKKLTAAVKTIGFPVLIKASAGGGGKGMRLVTEKGQLAEAVQSAMREAQASFGDSRIFLEKYLSQARHIEVQILFDQHGHGVYLFDRDCSVQRRHQKVIEEAPAPGLSESLRRKMADTALRAGAAIQYSSTGTIEFLVDENADFYFMEMNTRLQVEHPVTEMITGLDLVEWQLRIAADEPLTLKQQDIKIQGHAVEARLYAENPQHNFIPSAGMLHYFQLPPEQSPAIRVDSGFQTCDEVSVYYDPLLAKLIAWGESRTAAIQRLQYMLDETAVIGIYTNWTLLNRIIRHPQFIQGSITTHFIAQHQAQLLSEVMEPPDYIIAIAGLALLQRQKSEQSRLGEHNPDIFSPWTVHDHWRLNGRTLPVIALWRQNNLLRLSVSHQGHGYTFNWGQQTIEIESLHWRDDHGLVIHIGDKEIAAIIFMDENQITIFCAGEQWLFNLLNPAAATGALQTANTLQAPMPGTLVEVYVKPGQTVAAGEHLLVMEAMKMEHSLTAPRAGTIQAVFFKSGDRVNEGATLITYAE